MKSNVIPAGLHYSSEQPGERKDTKQEVNGKDQEVKLDLYLFQDADNKSFLSISLEKHSPEVYRSHSVCTAVTLTGSQLSLFPNTPGLKG